MVSMTKTVESISADIGLVTALERSTLEQELIQYGLDVSLEGYSSEAVRGLSLLLPAINDLKTTPVAGLVTVSPVYASFASDIPEKEWANTSILKVFAHNPPVFEAACKVFSLLEDHPDYLRMVFMGRLWANYYGEVCNRRLGDEILLKASKFIGIQDEIGTQISKLSTKADQSVARTIALRLREQSCALLEKMFEQDLYIALEYDPEGYNGYLGSYTKPLEDLIFEHKLFAQCFRILREKDALQDMSELEQTSIEHVRTTELVAADEEEMISIMQLNYASYPISFQSKVKKSLLNSFVNENSVFTLLRHDKHIVGFLRFDSTADDNGVLKELYFGSFNIDQSYSGGKLGEAIFEASIKQEKEKGIPIHADCNPVSPIVQRYLEWGFIGTRSYDFEGVPSVHIELDPQAKESHIAHKLEVSDIEALIIHHGIYKDITARPLEENDKMPELSKGFVLTRMCTINGKKDTYI